jgi:hypothetical protein
MPKVDDRTARLQELDAAIHHAYHRMMEYRHYGELPLAERCEDAMNRYLDARAAA